MPLYNPASNGTFQPVIVARRTAALALTNNAFNNIVFDAEDIDVDNAWDGTTYTVPVTGSYGFSIGLYLTVTGTVTAYDAYFDYTVGGSASTARIFGVRNLGNQAVTTYPVIGVVSAANLTTAGLVVFRIFVNFTGATAVSITSGARNSLVVTRLK